MEKSWKLAIEKVLAASSTPLHYAEITERILSQGYYATDGATPSATVNAQLATSIKHDGVNSPFVRVGKGIFALKTPPASIPTPQEGGEPEILNEAEVESSESVIRAFGMYWQRDWIVWRNTPKMLGKQQPLSKSVDFGAQRGIYILYDHHTVVYVGRSIDRPLAKRLYEHTVDRLGSRWDRFSWFGLLDVSPEGALRDSPLKPSTASLIATLESLLIEALEPPQNRRRGDDFSGIEYLQAQDPELKERELHNTLRDIEQKLRSGG